MCAPPLLIFLSQRGGAQGFSEQRHAYYMEMLTAGCWGPTTFTPPGLEGGSPQAQKGRTRAPSQ
eukprot:4977875-Alexandrium_andersonii.AAC.1